MIRTKDHCCFIYYALFRQTNICTLTAFVRYKSYTGMSFSRATAIDSIDGEMEAIQTLPENNYLIKLINKDCKSTNEILQ